MRTLRSSVPAAMAVIIAVLGTLLLGLLSTVTAAITLTATALIVPGTGTPNANVVAGYLQNADNYYIAPFDPTCTAANDCTLQGINYPAQFWPFPFAGWGGLSGAKWNDSTGQGIANLDTALQAALPTATSTNPDIVFGYSQGGNIVTREKSTLSGLTDAQKAALAFVMIGDTNRPNGGLFERLALLGTVPILDATFGLPAPTNTGIKTTDIAFQYDGVADFPLYPINLLADLNAIAGFWYVHGTYLAPNANSSTGELPDGYTPAELQAALANPNNQSVYGDTTYITIPTKTLPIVQPLLEFGGFTNTTFIVKPLVDLIEPVLRVLIDTGYNRSLSPGVPAPFQLIPLINPITLAQNLVQAAGQGVQAAISDITGQGGTPNTPSPVASTTTPVTTNIGARTAVSAVKTPTAATLTQVTPALESTTTTKSDPATPPTTTPKPLTANSPSATGVGDVKPAGKPGQQTGSTNTTTSTPGKAGHTGTAGKDGAGTNDTDSKGAQSGTSGQEVTIHKPAKPSAQQDDKPAKAAA
ncbi:MAG: PE-PPE domain-containing protein [Mycobacterium sp.]|nr:PE-PPE domain-containing protein [Mycobacterium sp.]